MFENILEKVLLKAAGQYIDGVDSKNLKVGIWGGDVTVKNVSLKEGIIDMLDLPVSLRFSHIGELKLKVPWKNLSSAPVEVFLDGVYLIISPKHQKDWSFKDYRGLQEKLQNLNEFAEECLKKFKETQKQQQKNKKDSEKDQGYVEKLTMRIIDNLQITVKSIHVRYEDTLSSQPNSWGLTLDQLDIFTTDKYGKKIYVDRTLKENQHEPMRKSLKLSNLGAYWNSKEQNMLSLKDQSVKLDVMEGMIKRGNSKDTRVQCEYLFSISSEAKLVQSPAGRAEKFPDIPEIQMQIDLNSIDFTLEQQQLQQIIKMAEFFTKYQKQLTNHKRSNKQLSKETIQKYQKKYMEQFKQIQLSPSKTVDDMDPSERETFEAIVTSLEYEDLYECTKQVMIQIAKEQKINELEKNKQKKQQGFFGGFFGGSKKKTEESLVTDDEVEQIDKFFEDNFAGEGLVVTNYKRPEDFVWFRLRFKLAGGFIRLNKPNEVTNEIEAISFNYATLGGEVQMRDDNMEVEINLQTLSLDNITENMSTRNQQIQHFLLPNQTVQNQDLIKVKFEKKPMEARHIDQKVSVDIKCIRIEYNPIFVQRATMFFDVKVEDEDLKNAAYDTAQDLKEKAAESSQQAIESQSILWLDVHLESPIIALPFKPDGSLQNEAWILNLGDLSVNTNPAILEKNIAQENKHKDMFDIKLSNIKMQYFPTLDYYNRLEMDPKFTLELEQGMQDKYNVINDFSINIGIVILKGEIPSLDTGKIQVNGLLPQLSLNLNQTIFKKLIKMGDIFAVQDEANIMDRDRRSSSIALEQAQTDKKQLVSNATKVGAIYVRGKLSHQWVKKSAVLSGRYLYLFASPKDSSPEEYHWVNNSEITQLDENEYGRPFSFKVKNKHAEICLSTDREKLTQAWMDEIEKIRSKPIVHKIDSNLSFNQSEISNQKSELKGEKEGKQQKEKKENPLQKNLCATFSINDVNLNLFEKDNYQPFLIFSTKSLGLNFDQYPVSFDMSLTLGGMYLQDFLYQHKDPSLKDFITSEESSGDKLDLISVQVSQKQKEHPEYQNVEMDIAVKLGNLIVNFKPDTLIKVLDFVKIENDKETVQLPDEALKYFDDQKSDITDTTAHTESQLVKLKPVETIAMQAKVTLNQVKIVMVNRRTHLALGSFSIQNIDLTFKQYVDEMQLDGTLGNLQLIDKTNYPQTIFREEDYDKARDTELIGLLKKEGEKESQSLLYISFRALNEGSQKVGKDNVHTFLKVKLSQIHINYMMQPIMRFLDYALVQLLGPLTTPELFMEDTSALNEKKQEEIKAKKEESQNPFIALKQLGKGKVRKELQNPKGMDMNVVIESPLIQVKPSPDSEEYLQIALGNIKITNERIKDDSRIVQSEGTGIQETYSDVFNIKLQDMAFTLVKNGIEHEMSKLFHFNIKINMPTLVNEYFYVFGNNLVIDRTMKIQCYLSPIILVLTNPDYGLVMKCLFHNISYDDGCERFMIHNYFENVEKQKEMEKNQVSKFQMIQQFKVEEQAKNEKDEEGKEELSEEENEEKKQKNFLNQPGSIDFQLDMENLSLFACEGKEAIPFARVTLNDLRIQFRKEASGEIYTNLYGFELDGSCFKKEEGNMYNEVGLLRRINIDKHHSEQQMKNITNLLHDIQESSIKGENFVGYSFPQFPSTLNNSAFNKDTPLQFVLEIKMSPNGDKDLKIKIKDFKILAETGPLLKLASFANTDESVQTPPPFYKATPEEDEELKQQFANQQVISVKYQGELEKAHGDDENEFDISSQQEQNKPFFDLEAEQEKQKKKEEEEKLNQQNKQQEGKMSMNIFISDVIICALIPGSRQILAIKGDFDVGITFQPMSLSPQEIREQIKVKKAEFDQMLDQMKQDREIEEEQKVKEKKSKSKSKEDLKQLQEDLPKFKPETYFKNTNLTQNFDVKIRGLEIFICNKKDLQNKEFRYVKKREILQPLDIKVTMLTFNPPLGPNYDVFYQRQKIDVEVDKLMLKVSSKDGLLLNTSFQYLMADLNAQEEEKSEEQKAQEKKKKEEKEEKEQAKEKEGFDERLKMTAEQKQQLLELQDDPSKLNEQAIKCTVGGLQIMIINDIGTIFTPVLDFNILDTEIVLANNSIQNKITISPIIFKANYYNPRVGQWEPVMEEVGFNIDMINNTIGTIKQHIIVEINDAYEQVQINFSTQFLAILLQMLNLVEQNTKNEKLEDFDIIHKRDQQVKTESVQSFMSEIDSKVSPYTIMNETGYPIEVQLDKDGSDVEKVRIKNNTSVNFEGDEDHDESQLFQKKKEKGLTKINATQKHNRVRVKILNDYLNCDVIRDIDLDRIRSKRMTFNKSQKLQGSSEVKLDLSTNRKILYISSGAVFKNNTSVKCMIKFGQKQGGTVDGDGNLIKPGQTLPVPIDQIFQYYQLIFVDKNGSEYYSEPKKVMELKPGHKQDLILSQNKHIRLRVEKDTQNKFKTNIMIDPPFKFKNCFPKPLLFQILSSSKKTTITKEIGTEDTYEEYDHAPNKKIYLKINLPGFFWSSEYELNEEKQLTFIPIKDHNNNSSQIQVCQHQAKNGTIEYYFYCTSYLVNETPYDLLIYTQHQKKKEKKPLIIGGQHEIMPEDDIEKNLVIFGKEQGEMLVITDKSMPNKFSKQVTIATPGNSEVEAYIKLNNREQLISLGVNVELKVSNQEPLLMTKEITVAPRYILINKTSKNILARQAGETGNNYARMRRDFRQPIFWSNHENPKEINLMFVNKDVKDEEISMLTPDDSTWDWSQNINVNNVGIVNFMCFSKDKKEKKFMRTDTREAGSFVFVVVEELPEDQIPFKIVNQSNQYDFILHNAGYEENKLSFQDQIDFCWYKPSDPRQLEITVVPKKEGYRHQKLKFSPDIINSVEKYKIKAEHGQDKKSYPDKFIKKTITIDGYTKIVSFEDSYKGEKFKKLKEKDTDVNKQQQDQISQADDDQMSDQRSATSRQSSLDIFSILQQINISFKGIGLSLIMNHQEPEKTKEILYLYMKNLELIKLQKEKSSIIQLRLQYINMDNNGEHIVQHPVILTPSAYKAHMDKTNPRQFINFYLEQNLTASQITLFDNIVFDMSPITVKIEEFFLNQVLEFVQAYNEISNSIRNDSQTEEKKKQNQKLHEHLQNKEYNWMTSEIPPYSSPTFIDQIVLTNIQINLTFQAKGRTGNQNSNLVLFETLFSAIGVVLANVDNTPLKLNGIKLNACFDTTQGIIQKLVKHYKSQAMTEALKVLGSLNIIGNPVGLFTNISSGVQDLIEKPMEGLVQGPLETGMGIMKGSASLLTKTISGAFNSISKITGTMSSGLYALSMDDDYIKEREKMRAKKPKHIADGVGQGLVSIVGGVGRGIAGVFLQPYLGAKNGGVLGFFKGTALGVVGLVTKPLGGIGEAIAQTAEGIQHTFSIFDDKPNIQRERAPRVFYGHDKFYKEFNDLDAEMSTFLQIYHKGEYASEYFYASFAFKMHAKDTQEHVLILVQKTIILFDKQEKKRAWVCKNSTISKVQNSENEIIFQLNTKNKHVKSNVIKMPVEKKELKNHIYEQIQELLNIYEEEKKIIGEDIFAAVTGGR